MAEAFRGEFGQKVDAKARVLIPVAFRRILDAGDPNSSAQRTRFVMVYGDERRRFVECYTMEGMAALEAQIAALPLGTPARRLLERNFITLSATIEIDEDGRIVLPARVRDKLGLTAEEIRGSVESVFAGTLQTFQIWRKTDFDTWLAEQEAEDMQLLADGQDMLTLLHGVG
ncbi:division/cell wall cluster transcriptional repressor MraZ [Falsirhodobacter algicola]|uniref:Transcriptional regulator MraZ n=1 Tax=Falsirhodobacter algicola TaxID=2692330 RepID=A0A8J8MR59_9RHOB|nr:division/cell wall cluster transcriptional repressor MraZ [Falsirhodobacter algicola]QUS35004.1 division/cell wall cluster transcriptional repressor MraZ [Falsirhodobacter algicola]